MKHIDLQIDIEKIGESSNKKALMGLITGACPEFCVKLKIKI